MQQAGRVARVRRHPDPGPVEGRIDRTDFRHVLEEGRRKEGGRTAGRPRQHRLVLVLVQVRVLVLVMVQLLAQVGRPGRSRRQAAAVQKPVVQLAP